MYSAGAMEGAGATHTPQSVMNQSICSMPMRTAAINKGVEICVEALNEWKIKEIAYDGTEKYVEPKRFKEVLAENAQLINWRKLVGEQNSFDNPDALEEEGEDLVSGERVAPNEQMEVDGREENERQSSAVQRDAPHTVEMPAAGPWATVAQNLHKSLQEVNVLMDALSVLRTDYVAALQVSSVDEPEQTQKMAIEQMKAFQLLTRKKAIAEAARMLDTVGQCRQRSANANAPPLEDDGSDAFFAELRILREKFRVRKVQKAVFGDLGYRTYGPKFLPDEQFHIYRRQQPLRLEGGSLSHIEVQVPYHLAQRTAVWVSIEKEVQECNGLHASNDSAPTLEKAKMSRQLHWEKAVEWAQESLLCRDMFDQLVRECATDAERQICIALSDDSLIIPLSGNWLLKVEISFLPFEASEIPVKGIPYLSDSLREIFLFDQFKAPMRSQQFVHLPQTKQPESLELPGPKALTVEDIAARKRESRSLLSRFLDVANHYLLLFHGNINTPLSSSQCMPITEEPATCLIEALRQHQLLYPDPQLQWKWTRCTPTFSMLTIMQVNRGYEVLGKHTIHIRVTSDEVVLVTKDHHRINCRGSMQLVRRALLLLTANFLYNSVAMLCKSFAWQLLHANSNAMDAAEEPAPTLYMCNQPATKQLFIQFPSNGDSPAIYMRAGEMANPSDQLKQSPTVKEEKNEDGNGGFQRLNYDRLLGSSLMRKIDTLLCSFSK